VRKNKGLTGKNGAPKGGKQGKTRGENGALSTVSDAPRGARRIRGARLLFLAAYERYYGNVTRACAYAGISRATYYRWARSGSRVNHRFRQRLELVHPKERLLDVAEGVIQDRLEAGSIRAAEFTLKHLGRNRGYAPTNRVENVVKPTTPAEELLERCVKGFAGFLEMQEPPEEQIEFWITVFARNGNVERAALAARVSLFGRLNQE
jgi:hypothetical protein